VTGAGSGFGRGIAERFAAEGAGVLVADIRPQPAEATAEAIRLAGGRAVPICVDVAREVDVALMVETARDVLGRLDILVNNAGVTHVNQPLDQVEATEFDRIFSVNVKALLWAARHAVPALAAQGGGSMINIASTAGIRPRPGLTWYNASKGAVITATKSMAVELAPRRIRVNALCPVAGDTPLLPSFLGEDTPERRAAFKATIPWGRLSRPEDVAAAALFLASDDSEFITGTALEVDGGRCV
jgi:3-oxoacyl-[acyl-carrier protein] reductase